MDTIRIRCPKCNWEPDGDAHWSCSCGTTWDTFSTGGRCPSCGKVWDDTQCIVTAGGCPEWSKHLDWYENLEKVADEATEVLSREEKITEAGL